MKEIFGRAPTAAWRGSSPGSFPSFRGTIPEAKHLYKEIATQLGISVFTVNNFIRRIYEKLHVTSRGQAVAHALAAGNRSQRRLNERGRHRSFRSKIGYRVPRLRRWPPRDWG